MNPASIIIPCASEGEWLAVRNDPRYLGASDIPTLFGLGFLSPLELWIQKKTGVSNVKESERMTAGKFLEPANAAWYAHANERNVERPQEFYGDKTDPRCPFRHAFAVIVRHPTLPLQCTPDRFTFALRPGEIAPATAWPSPRVLQLKNADARLLDEWSEDEPPIRVQCQVQAEMLCTGLQWGAIGAIIGGNTRRDADVTAHPEFQRTLAMLAKAFLASIESNQPPDAEAGDSAAVRLLYPRETPGSSIELPRPELALELAHLQAEHTGREKEIDRLKAEIALDLGDAEEGTIGGTIAIKYRLEGEAKTITYEKKPARVLRIQKAIKPLKENHDHRTAILPA